VTRLYTKETNLALRIRGIFIELVVDALFENWWCPYCLSNRVVKVITVTEDKKGNIGYDYSEDYYWFCRCCGYDWEDYDENLDIDLKKLSRTKRKLKRVVKK